MKITVSVSRSAFSGTAGPLDPRPTWILLFLAVVALVYCGAYLAIGFLPGNSQHPLGWWGWWDQSQYLKSAEAFATWNLDRSNHLYPLGYSLLATPFVKLVPLHGFFFTNLVSFVAFAWLMVRLGQQLGVGALAGGAAFVIGAVGSDILLAQYVIPWTTTPVAAIYAALFVLYLASVKDGFTPRRVGLMVGGVVLVAAIRPVDVLPLLPLIVLVVWSCLSTNRASENGSTALRRLVPALLPAALLLVAYVALHVSIYGFRQSDYFKAVSSGSGLDLSIVPFRYWVLFADPRPFFGTGTGVFERFPLLMLGLWALIYLTLAQRSLFAITGAVWLSLLVYLAFVDFTPTGIWKFFNLHYWKWMFPVVALLCIVAIRHAAAARSRLLAIAAVMATLPLVTLSLDVVRTPAASIRIVDPNQIEMVAAQARLVAAVEIHGLEGGDNEVYNGQHRINLDGAELRNVRDFRIVRAEKSVFAVFNRPRDVGQMMVILADGVSPAAAIQATFLGPELGLRNPFVRRSSLADTLVSWPGAWREPRCEGEPLRSDVAPSSDGEFVRLAYRAVLGREPDLSGFKGGCELLVSGRLTRKQFIDGISASSEFKARLR
jgi:hypothetical protein